MNQTRENFLPLYAEEQIIHQEQNQIQAILNRFKQPIPSNFLKLEVAKKIIEVRPKA